MKLKNRKTKDTATEILAYHIYASSESHRTKKLLSICKLIFMVVLSPSLGIPLKPWLVVLAKFANVCSSLSASLPICLNVILSVLLCMYVAHWTTVSTDLHEGRSYNSALSKAFTSTLQSVKMNTFGSHMHVSWVCRFCNV